MNFAKQEKKDQAIAARVPKALWEALARQAEMEDTSRNDALVRMLQRGLVASELIRRPANRTLAQRFITLQSIGSMEELIARVVGEWLERLREEGRPARAGQGE